MHMFFKKIISAALTLLLASIAIFVFVRFAPGDPVNLAIGYTPGDHMINTEMMEQRREALREKHNLNSTILVQYLTWAKNILCFNLGQSIQTGRPITAELLNRMPATFMLSFAALIFQTLFGVGAGIYSAIKAGKIFDHSIRLICVILASVPAFVLSLILLFIFSVNWQIYEIGNSANFDRLWLPAIVLGLLGAPQITRISRSNMLSEMGKIYVGASVSRGLSKWLVIKGAFRNALLPMITTIALSFAHLIGGSIVIESIFSWPGIGNYALSSVLLNDYPAIQGYTVLTVAFVILINLSVEVLYLIVDPRLRNRNKQIISGAINLRRTCIND